MDFVTDKQTLSDLNILGRYNSNSIFSLFNHTITVGGSRALEKMFQKPLTVESSINERSSLFSFFESLALSLPFTSEEFDIVENYLHNPQSKSRLIAGLNIAKYKLLHQFASGKEYTMIREGLEKTIEVFSRLKLVIQTIANSSTNTPYDATVKKMLSLLTSESLNEAWRFIKNEGLSYKQVMKLDYVFRGLLYDKNEEFLNELYNLDVYITVSDVSRMNKLAYANAVAKQERFIDIQGLYHPGIPGAVANDISIEKDKHVLFLTGANMAGKSTLMKAFAVAVYLAHMGFPVAAHQMNFSVHDGIYTSINVPDNLEMGYSHFYAEVLRVKHIAEEVATDKQLVIIFDELFKGTNVKDASDGTVAVVDAFSRRKGTFIISTHIMEAGEILKKTNKYLFFKYLPTIIKGKVPTYPYTLEDGITDDCQGMMIIENERILEIINGDK